MLKQGCMVCKVFGALAIVGAINWGVIAITGTNYLENALGAGSTAVRVVYGLIGVSGLALLVSCFLSCPACKK